MTCVWKLCRCAADRLLCKLDRGPSALIHAQINLQLGAPLQIPRAGWSWRTDLGRQGGSRASILPLRALIITYYDLIMPLSCPCPH